MNIPEELVSLRLGALVGVGDDGDEVDPQHLQLQHPDQQLVFFVKVREHGVEFL